MSVKFAPDGVWTAIVTPFNTHGALDTDALKQLIDFQISEGVKGVVPAGTTGESPTLTWEEHNQVIELAAKFCGGRAGVLAGTGSNSTHEAIEATHHAQESGASAALLVDCYYNGPSSLELREEYYEQVASRVRALPLVPYIIPGRSGTALSAEDLAVLHLNAPNRFPAVKEATGDLQRMRIDRALCGKTLAILSGDDDLTLAMMQDAEIAASGVVSVMSNIVPGAMCRMVRAQHEGDTTSAAAIAKAIDPLFKLVGCKVPGTRKLPDGRVLNVEDKFRNPVPAKTMMAGLGMPVGASRKPLGKMSKAGVAECRGALQAVFRTRPEFLQPIGESFGANIEQRLNDDSVWAALTRN